MFRNAGFMQNIPIYESFVLPSIIFAFFPAWLAEYGGCTQPCSFFPLPAEEYFEVEDFGV